MNDLDCPICLEQLKCPLETSCGHSFCSQCILHYWETLPNGSPYKCPMDRNIVSFIIPSRFRSKLPHCDCSEWDSSIQHWNDRLRGQRQDFTSSLNENINLLTRFFYVSEYGKIIFAIVFMIVLLYTISPGKMNDYEFIVLQWI